MSDNLKLTVGIEVIQSYKRLSYTAWYAFAEFVDNSTQAYFNNKLKLDEAFKKSGDRLFVQLEYDRSASIITIKDNSIGMSKLELEAALKIGVPPKNDKERSKYGLGMKTAACWFGNVWSVKTKKLGETDGVMVTIDVNKVAKEKEPFLPTELFKEEMDKHYTEITITELNRQYHGNTLNKVKEFLMSMYRFDFDEIGLVLKWQGDELSWEGFEKRFYITQEGKPYKVPLNFKIGEPLKQITGWVGVLSKGSRKDAGFSIIQNKRVIRGWPNAYKPVSVFGDQDLGTNDLINQRVVGELYVDGFAVSHTKDNILWQDTEEEELENILGELCHDARLLALTIRVKQTPSDRVSAERDKAFSVFESELKSNEISDTLFNIDIPDEKIIAISYKRLIAAVQESDDPTIEVGIGKDDPIYVKIYFRSVSEFEPYVLIEVSTDNNTLIVIINSLHPHWIDLKSAEGFLSFVRHCVYDGLSEWRAYKKTTKINHDTVKYIKDQLMRLPFDILNNKLQSFVNTQD